MSFDNVVLIIIYFVFIKSMAFGSDFNFYYVFKYGKRYWKWYKNRETFNDYLEKGNEKWKLKNL